MTKDKLVWLRKSDLARHYGVDPSTIIRWANHKGDFPKPVKITDGMTAWHRSQIEAYDRKLLGGDMNYRDWTDGRTREEQLAYLRSVGAAV